MDEKPRSFKWRTKIPMLPQKSPAIIIRILPTMLFDFSIDSNYITENVLHGAWVTMNFALCYLVSVKEAVGHG